MNAMSSELPSIDFANIRSERGGQDEAFEEFCCHVAKRQLKSLPAGTKFVRLHGKGGDGGVECLLVRPDGSKWGWQAKYVFKMDTALRLLDKSVDTALKTHTELYRYTVCLPFDPSGRTAKRKGSGIASFDRHRAKWKAQAKDSAMSVDFELWSRSHLSSEVLKMDGAAGRVQYWFGSGVLDELWFRDNIDRALKDSEPRYNPKLPIDVPVAAALEAFGSTREWRKRVESQLVELEKLRLRWKKSMASRGGTGMDPPLPDSLRSDAEVLSRHLDSITTLLQAEASAEPGSDATLSVFDQAVEAAERCESIVVSDLEKRHGPGTANSVGFRQFAAEYEVSFPATHVDTIRDILKWLEMARTDSVPLIELSRSHATLLLGEAWIGKTHSICDAAFIRLRRGLRSVVLLGQQFSDAEPWHQAQILLRVPTDMTQDDMLDALDAAGEATGSPTVIYIDALNESRPNSIWQRYLASMVADVSKRQWLKLCLSCRSGFEAEALPEHLSIPEVRHTGFRDVEFTAWPKFFKFYDLAAPETPILQPEYANPGFLGVICGAARDSGMKELPSGVEGLRALVDFLLTAKNKKLFRQIGYLESENLVRAAMMSLAARMCAASRSFLDIKEARIAVSETVPNPTIGDSLFRALMHEHLLAEDRVFEEEAGHPVPVVRMGYERFTHFMIAEHLLEGVVAKDVRRTLVHDGTLSKALEQESGRPNVGLLQALAILLPAKYGLELPDVLTEAHLVPLARKALVDTLIWRGSRDITADTMSMVMDALTDRELFKSTMDALLSVSTLPKHPMGAAWLHNLLMDEPMPDRDHFWCPYLRLSWGERSPLDRLIKWALDVEIQSVSPEPAVAWATALSWFTAAADRRVRDHATAALVRILELRPESVVAVIKRFAQVDDEYVLERVLAAALGSLTRLGKEAPVKDVAQTVYDEVFKKRGLPANASVRDYARLIMELAVARGVLPAGVPERAFRPPYGNAPQVVWPDDSLRESYKDSSGEYPKLLYSCTDDDFFTYTIASATFRYGLDVPRRAGLWVFKHVLDMGYTPARFRNYDASMGAKFGFGRGTPRWAERIGKKYQWIALYRLLGLLEDQATGKPGEPAAPALQADRQRNIDPTVRATDSSETEATTWWVPQTYRFGNGPYDPSEWLKTSDALDSRSLLEVAHPADGRRWLILWEYLDWWDKEHTGHNDYPRRQYWQHIQSYLVMSNENQKCWEWLASQPIHRFLVPDLCTFRSGFVGEYPWGPTFAEEIREIWDEVIMGTRKQHGVTLLPTAYQIRERYEYDCYRPHGRTPLVPAESLLERPTLLWKPESRYVDKKQRTVFECPTCTNDRPEALVVDKEHLVNWLQTNKLRLVWTTYGEKTYLEDAPPQRYFGRSEFSTVHRLAGHQIRSGPARFTFIPPKNDER